MRATLSLFRREFAAYFSGPIGYVAMFGFLILTGLQFNLALTLCLCASCTLDVGAGSIMMPCPGR